MRHAFSDVDRAEDVDFLTTALEQQARVLETKRRQRWEALDLRPGDIVLDAGCGLGEVAREFAARVAPGGHVVGIDHSELMIARARTASAQSSLPVDYRIGDIHALDCPDDFFSKVHCERVLMHLDDPDAALAELIRVTRPGGTIMVADADIGMEVTDSNDEEAMALLKRLAVRTASKNPSSGRRLYGQFRRAGLDDVSVSGELVTVVEPMFGRASFLDFYKPLIDQLVGTGTLASERGDALWRELGSQLEDRQHFSAAGLMTVTGRKPL